jgi:tetratricopeptide (TPR) repeat protein
MVREPLPDLKRKRLERIFEVAKTKSASATATADFDYLTDLLGQCVNGDPGNPAYVQAYLENLQKKFGSLKKSGALGKIQEKLARFQESGARSALKKAVSQEQWDEVVRQGLKVLTVNPWDLPTLTAMATAAAKSGDRDCELCYLQAALKGHPRDAACTRSYAIALGERGLIDHSIVWWHRVEDILPGNEEALRNIATLTVQKARTSGKFDDDGDVARKAKVRAQQQEELGREQQLRKKIQQEPDVLANYLELAQLYIGDDRFRDAEGLLAKAFELSDGEIEIRDQWEDCQLRLMRQNVAQTKDPEARKKLQLERLEKEAVIYRGRVERFPTNLALRYELGLRLMQTKRCNEAIPELQIAKREPRKQGVCLLRLGQCFEQIKQYPLAKDHYEAAIQEISDHDADNRKQALYLAGRLALDLKDLDTAQKHLTALAGLDFTYKDVPTLLDKIAKLRENPESV